MTMNYLFTPPAPVSVPVVGSTAHFPVHRIYCVGRNYEEHAKEMGFTGRDMADGRSWEAWVKKYTERKAAGETNIELVPEAME